MREIWSIPPPSAGVLYIALVVARLVGLTVVRQSNRPPHVD